MNLNEIENDFKFKIKKFLGNFVQNRSSLKSSELHMSCGKRLVFMLKFHD